MAQNYKMKVRKGPKLQDESAQRPKNYKMKVRKGQKTPKQQIQNLFDFHSLSYLYVSFTPIHMLMLYPFRGPYLRLPLCFRAWD